jgi:hypothetical protein
VAENAPMEKTTIPKDPPGNATPDENQPIEVMLLKQCHVYHPPVSPSH